MSVFKPFITSDVTVSPFKVNKTFTFNGETEMDDVNINRFIGKNITSSLWISGSNPTSTSNTQDKELIYNSIKHLYYSNYISGSNGSPSSTASFNPDGTITGDTYTPNSYNYLSTTLSPNRYFPTGSNELIGVYSIPSTLFGEYIKPTSFSLRNQDNIITDNGEGMLYYNNTLVGNIIYEHGMIILHEDPPSGFYGSLIYGLGTYGSSAIISDFITNNTTTCSFQSTTTIFESQYKCTLRQNEFTFSQNPTLISGSSNSGVLSDFATGSYFNPYVTSVGLYNNNKELIAIAKLAQPLPISSMTDTNIIINLDL